jgi:hypothetical protein
MMRLFFCIALYATLHQKFLCAKAKGVSRGACPELAVFVMGYITKTASCGTRFVTPFALSFLNTNLPREMHTHQLQSATSSPFQYNTPIS